MLGPGEEVGLEHGLQLHYCQAVIAEVQRLGQVAVTSIMHRLTTQVNIRNLYKQYKHLHVKHKLYSVHAAKWTRPAKRLPHIFKL